MSALPCPIPDVDAALSSFIRSRQETLRIRKILARHLTAQLRDSQPHARELQHLSIACPQESTTAKPNSSDLRGNRIAYLRALQAKQAAQKKHAELQASLDELRNRHCNDATAHDAVCDDDAVRARITLLRQRTRYAELEVIQNSLGRLLEAHPVTVPKDPKTIVQEAIGEQPNLPAERLEPAAQSQDVEDWIFRLKKEVLSTKTSMDEANANREALRQRGAETSGLADQVYALSRARDELAGWVENELSKMNEESELLEDASPVKRHPPEAPLDAASTEALIREIYQRYTASRSSLLGAIEIAQQPTAQPQPNDSQFKPDSRLSTATSTSKISIASVLPHLPTFMGISNNEQSLLQQTVYLQGQLSAAAEEANESLTKLAEESHLLSSGGNGAVAWGQNAMEAEKSTQEFVAERLQESQAEVGGVDRVVNISSLHNKVLNIK